MIYNYSIVAAIVGFASFAGFYSIGYSSGGGLFFSISVSFAFAIGLFMILLCSYEPKVSEKEFEKIFAKERKNLFSKFDGRVILEYDMLEEQRYEIRAYIKKNNAKRNEKEEKEIGRYLNLAFYKNICGHQIESIVVASINDFSDISKIRAVISKAA